MADYYTEQSMNGMGQMPPGTDTSPNGALDSHRYGALAVAAFTGGRSYSALTSAESRRLSYSKWWIRRNKWMQPSRGNMEKMIDPSGMAKARSGRQRTRMSYATVASEAQTLSRGVEQWFPAMLFQRGANMGDRSFLTRGLFEQSLAHINLSAANAPYSRKQLMSMGDRMWRIATVRGAGKAGHYTNMASLLGKESLEEIWDVGGKKALQTRIGYVAGQMMPSSISKLTAKIGANKFGAMAGKAIGMANPVLAAYFAFKLTADIAEWSTKKILRGANWYFFKMPLQVYQAGTRDLRAPILRSGTYVDTPGAQTNRQRAVLAIQNSRLNARSALGSEGALMHNYFG
jgi:hypothetical protein